MKLYKQHYVYSLSIATKQITSRFSKFEQALIVSVYVSRNLEQLIWGPVSWGGPQGDCQGVGSHLGLAPAEDLLLSSFVWQVAGSTIPYPTPLLMMRQLASHRASDPEETGRY